MSTAARLTLEPASGRGRTAAAVAAAVDAVPGVRRCTGGLGATIAGTQFAGGRVDGVVLGSEEVTVHVVAEDLPIPPLVEQVRAAARRALGAAGDLRPVGVAVDDLDLPDLTEEDGQ